jgi:hypothetical protein
MSFNMVAIQTAVLALTVSTSLAGQTQPPKAEQPQTRSAAPRQSLMDSVKRSLQRLGASVDSSRSSAQMVVSNYGDARGKTTIVIVSDRAKNLLGLYIYNFGNLKQESNREAVFQYLLNANDAITIGAFFVDSENDIGYKYLMNIGQSLNQASFEASYLMMAAVARDRRPEIRKMLEKQ